MIAHAPPADRAAAPSKLAQTHALPIPYRHGGSSSDPSLLSALATTLVLLAAVAALAWHARRKGWLDRWITPTKPVPGRRLAVIEVTALSRSTRLYRVRDGEREFLLAESTAQLQVLGAGTGALTELQP